jgi:hypothetical protein
MEEELDFDFPQIELAPINYVAVFDKETGAVISIGPEDSFKDVENKISVDKEFFIDVVECRVNIHNCFIDFYDLKLEVKEIKNLYKIDDVLHRIPESKFVDFIDADIYATYNSSAGQLIIELTERFHGTRSLVETDVKKQKTIWSGDTQLNFFITEYNDPHKLIKAVSINLDNLINDPYVLDLHLPEKFSIFTRRLFKKYIMEIK